MKHHSLVRGAIAILLLGCSQAALAQAEISPEKQTAIEQVDALEPEIERMSLELWNYSETALRETRSAAFLADVLEEEGFTLERGVAGMPTAFVAQWGQGGPVIGILAEYDALPDIGNEAVPFRKPREDGTAHGHGCGHNLFGAGSAAAAIAA
jgi:aminobenzoyl-glutamate utilization protein B